MIYVNIHTFKQIGDRRIHFKAKVTLILCVFSGSDVGSKWWLLYSLLNPTTEHLNRFPFTGVDKMVEWWQHTQGGSKVRWPCQSTNVGVVCTDVRHSDRNLRTAWLEKWYFKIAKKKKNTGWIFIIIRWMCTHTLPTHIYVKTTWKVNFAFDDPFNVNEEIERLTLQQYFSNMRKFKCDH